MAEGVVLGHRVEIGDGSTLTSWKDRGDQYAPVTVHGRLGTNAEVSLRVGMITKMPDYSKGEKYSRSGDAHLNLAEGAVLSFHAHISVNRALSPYTYTPFKARLGKGARFSTSSGKYGAEGHSVVLADLVVGNGAVVDGYDDVRWGSNPCKFVVGDGAIVESIVVHYGRKHQRTIGVGARVGKGAVLAADVPDGATVLPGRTVDGNTVFLSNEVGTVTVTAAGVDCFGGITDGDVIVDYARELYAARVRACQAEAAKAKADSAREQAETDYNAKAEEASRAEQRARSAEGRVDGLRQEANDARRLANDVQAKLAELDDLRARIATALAICSGSRAKVASAVEAALVVTESEEFAV